MPAWVAAGFEQYRKRLGRELPFTLRELPSAMRGRACDPVRVLEEEHRRLLAAVPGGARVVLLDERGSPWSTRQLAERVSAWRQDGRDVALLVGGPDGVSPGLRGRADDLWSLGPLTLPHPLVRVIVVEQLYRAVSLLAGHPYHRD